MNFDASGNRSGAGIDPLSGRFDELVSVLTNATATASSPTVSVRVGADGALQHLQIDDRALHGGAAALAAHLLEVVGRAHADVAERRRAAESALRADPRVAEAVSAVAGAVDSPRPEPVRGESASDDGRPASFLISAVDHYRK
ncbi:MAG: hypothetical protein WAX14_13470 [Rhodococcus sp. (in: high G+C Gram-positive bacteria)]|uniref:hypothetical protein n=1 Tax=Rhodococcus sp. TaxID=1831 RepID=UPI003BB73B8B